jgi:hypothetical protein
MTNQQHPITPPPDLVEQWLKEFYGAKLEYVAEASIHLAARAARRPKPPSLKEQAYAALDAYVYGNPDHGDKQNTYNTIRRALEQLDD